MGPVSWKLPATGNQQILYSSHTFVTSVPNSYSWCLPFEALGLVSLHSGSTFRHCQ